MERKQFLSEFGKRIRGLIRKKWKSYREASEALGIPESTLSWYARGAGEPSAGLLHELAKKLNVSAGYLLCLTDDPSSGSFGAGPTVVFVEKLDALPAAGAGAMNDAVHVVEALEFPIWMAQKLTKTARGKVGSLRFMRALGDSMEPLIEPGALLLVDGSDSDHRRPPKPRKASDHNNIYVFLQDGALRVKRLRQDRKGFTIAMSENPAYDPEILGKQDFKVLGRVIWWDNRL
jgi:phage repressor protein C with HTH and peptisase S24 domain